MIVGDGAFQMTGMELSTVARYGLNPIVVVLNNHGYTTERFLLDGPFNDIHEWQFHKIPEVLGRGLGLEVRTEGELDAALGPRPGQHRELQPPERPPRPLRPQPRPRTAGAEALEDRLTRRAEPARRRRGRLARTAGRPSPAPRRVAGSSSCRRRS